MANEPPPSDLVGAIKLDKWRKEVGLSRSTVWRLRRDGRLKVISRYGMLFVTPEAQQEFFQAK